MTWTLDRCTLTGADDYTDIDQLWEIAAAFPFVEWGVLYSVSQRGVGRYPSKAWLQRLVDRIAAGGLTPNFAIHVCGRAVGDLIAGVGDITSIVQHFGRVQVNFRSENFRLGDIRGMLERQANRTIITQHNVANASLWLGLKTLPNHASLFDASGGRGIARTAWPTPLPGVSCGYAGGLGPDNIEESLASIQRAAGSSRYWIDMEGKLRSGDDRFDLTLAHAVLERVRRVIATAEVVNG